MTGVTVEQVCARLADPAFMAAARMSLLARIRGWWRTGQWLSADQAMMLKAVALLTDEQAQAFYVKPTEGLL